MNKRLGLLTVVLLTTVTLSACGNSKSETMSAEQKDCQTAITEHLNTMSTVGQGDEAKDGDMVTVDYVGRLSDHEVFDTSIKNVATACGKFQEGRNYETGLPFILGKKQMIPGFEEAVLGMKVGESKTVTLTPDQAYGERDEKNLLEVTKDKLPENDKEWKVGDEIQTFFGPMPIYDIKGDIVVIDRNSPLAGKTLIFDITLTNIQKADDVALPEIGIDDTVTTGTAQENQ